MEEILNRKKGRKLTLKNQQKHKQTTDKAKYVCIVRGLLFNYLFIFAKSIQYPNMCRCK